MCVYVTHCSSALKSGKLGPVWTVRTPSLRVYSMVLTIIVNYRALSEL